MTDVPGKVVRTRVYTRDGQRYRITVTAYLSKLRGNARPYFSITADQRREERGYWREDACGCMHEEILAQWPDLFDFVALHLSDDDGAPTYAEVNGWYWFAGTFDNGAWERYHGSSRDYRGRQSHTPDDCLRIFANHARITIEEAQHLRERIKVHHDNYEPSRMRAECIAWLEEQRPRWKREADALISKYQLTVIEG